MTLNDQVVQAVLATIDELNDYLPENRRIDRSTGTRLFGEGGALDSLGLVNFLLTLEGRIADELGCSVSLADERALSERNSPFRTVESLASYATRLVEEVRAQ